MEISKINFNLPLLNNNSIGPTIDIEEEFCSDSCVLKDHMSFTYVLNTPSANNNYLYKTNKNTIVKKRKHLKDTTWTEFGTEYFINVAQQEILYSRLIDNPINELSKLKKICKCSMEVEYVEGELLEPHTNPVYYSHKLMNTASTLINESNIWEFIALSLKGLKTLHNHGIVHGDPCSHNIIITKNSVKFIDLDTLMPANKENIDRDFFIFIFFGIVPLVKRFLTREQALSIIKKIFDTCYNHGSFSSISVDQLMSNEEFLYKSIDDGICWYFDFLYTNADRISSELAYEKQKNSELRISILDMNRILNNRIQEIEVDRENRLKVIEEQQKALNAFRLDNESKQRIIEQQQIDLDKLKQKNSELRISILDMNRILNNRIQEIEVDRENRLKVIEEHQKALNAFRLDNESKQKIIEQQQIDLDKLRQDNEKKQKYINQIISSPFVKYLIKMGLIKRDEDGDL